MKAAVVDRTGTYEELTRTSLAIAQFARESIGRTDTLSPLLKDACLAVLRHEEKQQGIFRLLPSALFTAHRDECLTVGAASRAWWAGAETLDDLNDGHFDPAGTGLSASRAMLAATTCLTLIPAEMIRERGCPAATEVRLGHEMTRASIQAAAGQLDDVGETGATDAMWARIMRSYAGKTGAAYGRDLAMMALLAGESDDRVAAWRSFGALFGVLRQMANDRHGLDDLDHEDYRNGTRTLIYAHAMDALTGERRTAFAEIHGAARRDTGAREALFGEYRSDDLAAGYDDRIEGIRAGLQSALHELAPPSDGRDLARWMIDESARGAAIR
ncbi:polyprenyl synthetase family protein [Actinoplanes sp. CA-131856]